MFGGTEMNFNTQISTSVEQSRQLLALGIKKETADMVWMAEMGFDAKSFRVYDTGDYFLRPVDYLEGEEYRDNVPAWSFHRLIAMCPDFVIAEQRNHEKLYEQVIANIKFAIEEGSFDEKYLEE